MNNARMKWLVFAVLVLSPPFFFNSCQGGPLGSKGFSSASTSLSSSNCKVQNGQFLKANSAALKAQRLPTPFENQKVRLSKNWSEEDPVFAKASQETTPDLASGSELSVVLSNTCVSSGLSLSPLSEILVASGQMIYGLDQQAYAWVLDRDYSGTEIDELVGADECIVGLSWDREYKLMSAFNDPLATSQIHLDALHASEAYPYLYNDSGGMEKTGSPPVLVAVIDSGVDWQHPDLSGNMWAHSAGIGIDITTLGSSLVDYNAYDVSDIGHGTHVAGLIAAIGNNNVGTTGIIPHRAKIMAIRTVKRLSNGDLNITSTYLYNSLRFAGLNGADVANLSVGTLSAGANTDATLEAGVVDALNSGVFVVTVIGNTGSGSAGNVARNIDGVNYSSVPAQYSVRDGVVAVGSFDASTGEKSTFSHYSTKYVEISAPGAEQGYTGILSTLPTSQGSYGRLAGTSQAGPLVSGAAALIIGMLREAYNADPTPKETERLLLASASHSNALAPYFKDGNRLDLVNLVKTLNEEYPKTKTNGSPGLIGTGTSGCE